MDSLQPSLWDNVSLENGYRKLAELQLTAAIREFDAALGMEMGQGDAIRHGIRTAAFWRERIGEGGAHAAGAPYWQWLEDFASYGFDGRMLAFKKRLLSHIVAGMLEAGAPGTEEGKCAFDLLLGCGCYDQAQQLAAGFRERFPEVADWYYMEAQAWWRSKDKAEAGRLQAAALLLDPGSLEVSRIENPVLRELIGRHGTEYAPAYGWIQGALPLVSLPEALVICHERHEQAILAYDAMRSAHLFLKSDDRGTYIRFRKALKELDPELFGHYLAVAGTRV